MLNKYNPKLEEYTSARRAPHKSLVSKFSKVIKGPKDSAQTTYEPMRSILWRPSLHHDNQSDSFQKAQQNNQNAYPNKNVTYKKLIGKEKAKKYEKLPPGFDEERGFLEDYKNMDMNTFLDEDEEEGYGLWKWFVVVLVFFFVLAAYLLRVWGQRESLESISN